MFDITKAKKIKIDFYNISLEKILFFSLKLKVTFSFF